MNFWDIQDEVKQLKRARKNEEALCLLWQSISHHEKVSRRLYSWPYEQAAIVLRKLKKYDLEVALCEHYLSLDSTAKPFQKKIAARLGKAYLLSGQAEQRQSETGKVIHHLQDDVPIQFRPAFLRQGLAVNVETTGLSNKDEIIELAAVNFTFSKYNGHILHTGEHYVGMRQPKAKISKGAQRVHPVPGPRLAGQRLDDERVKSLIAAADLIVAHNASFDRRFMINLYPEISSKPWYCSMYGIGWHSLGHDSRELQHILRDLDVSNDRVDRSFDDAMSVISVLQYPHARTGQPFSVELFTAGPIEPKGKRSERRAARERKPPAELEFAFADLLPLIPQTEEELEDLEFAAETVSTPRQEHKPAYQELRGFVADFIVWLLLPFWVVLLIALNAFSL